MTQEATQITTTPPLPGLQLVQDLNKALQTLGTDFAGSSDPAALAWPYATWVDTGTGTVKRRNAANSAWVIEGRLFRSHMPIIPAAEVPASDIGPIYIVGVGSAEWVGAESAYRRTAHQYDAPADGLTYARNNNSWVALDDASPACSALVKSTDAGPCLIKTAPDALSVAADTYVRVGGIYHHFDVETGITMPGVLVPGSDYSVWCSPSGELTSILDPFANPATAPAPGAVKIGGFHYGLVEPGATVASGGFSTGGVTSNGGSMAWTQADVDRIAGINEFSIWDLAWRCKGEQRGMTYDPIAGIWVGIYFMGTTPHIDGPSAYNTDVASGTVLPVIPPVWGGDGVLKYAALRSWEANELVTAFGLRLIRYEEFASAAFGVTEGQSLGGGSVTIPATMRQPGYTSRIGIEQATGHHWIVGGPIHSVNGSAYAGNGRGSWYGTTGLVLLGGPRGFAAHSGSRCAFFNHSLAGSLWDFGVRAAGDHLKLVGAAR